MLFRLSGCSLSFVFFWSCWAVAAAMMLHVGLLIMVKMVLLLLIRGSQPTRKAGYDAIFAALIMSAPPISPTWLGIEIRDPTPHSQHNPQTRNPIAPSPNGSQTPSLKPREAQNLKDQALSLLRWRPRASAGKSQVALKEEALSRTCRITFGFKGLG